MNQLIVALGIGMCLALLAAWRPRYAVVATFVFMALLGDLRRYLVTQLGQVSNDPTLLIVPAVAAVLFLKAWASGGFRRWSPLSILVLALMLIMGLEIANPLQGGLTIGIAGALFYLVPLLWFWIGRAFGSPAFVYELLCKVVVPLAIAAALLGLYQTFFGFLHFEAVWVHLTGASTIYVENRYRPFAFFVSPAEYCIYLTVGLVIAVAPLLAGRPRPDILALPLFLLAIFLFGARGPLLTVIVAVAIMWAALGRDFRSVVPRLLLAVLVFSGALLLLLRNLQNANLSEQVRPFVDRQTQLLRDPSQTTAGIHWELFVEGVTEGLKNPFGLGLGASTPAASKFGGQGSNSEMDVANMFVSLGVIGGLLYIAVAVVAVSSAAGYWVRSHSVLALTVLGILIVLVFQWSNGGMYSIAAIAWFCIGSVDRTRAQALEVQHERAGTSRTFIGARPRENRTSSNRPGQQTSAPA